MIASGIAGLTPGRVLTEDDAANPAAQPRSQAEADVIALADRGVRGVSVRLAPTVHGAGDHGFVAVLVAAARRTGVAGYIGDGANRWSAVHRSDAARLFRLAVESAPAGAVLHGVAEQGVPTREIAEALGRGLSLPVRSIAPADAGEQFGFLGGFFGLDMQAGNARTRERLGWEPTGPGLVEDLDQGHYFN